MDGVFDTLDDALFYAAQAVYSRDGNASEHAALVFEDPQGNIRFSEPQGGQSKHKFAQGIKIPKGSRLLAMVHNHPTNKDVGLNDRFSRDDVEQAKKMNLMSAIAFGDDMSVRTFNPGVTAMGSIKDRHVKGDPFNHIPEVKPVGQRIGSLYQQLASTP